LVGQGIIGGIAPKWLTPPDQPRNYAIAEAPPLQPTLLHPKKITHFLHPPIFPRKILPFRGNFPHTMSEHPESPDESLVDQLTRHQSSLFHYILSLVPDRASAEDILQETNLVVWRKASEFDPSLPFMPWACRIALFQVKAHRRDQARDRHIFDDDVLDQLAGEAPTSTEARPIEIGLRECLSRLPEKQRELILARYQPGASVDTLAESSGLTANALSQSLFRIRRALAECLERQLRTS